VRDHRAFRWPGGGLRCRGGGEEGGWFRGGEDVGLPDVFRGSRGARPKPETRRSKEIRKLKVGRAITYGHEVKAGRSANREAGKRPATSGGNSYRAETILSLKRSLRLAGPWLIRLASDPLDGLRGFKSGGRSDPTPEPNRRANEDPRGRKRHKCLRAVPVGQCLVRI
jgi:hypothetical protein